METKKIPLHELCDFQNGFAFSSSDYSDEGTIVLRMSNISREGRFNINSENIKFIPRNKINGLERFLLKKNDVVIAMTDMSKDMGIIGRTAIVDEDDKYILNQRVGRFIIKSEFFYYKYLHSYTNSNYFIDYIKKCCGGGLQMNVSTSDIMNYEIPLPDLKTQHKIASILEQADTARQKRKQANQLTEQFLQSVFIEMFGDPVRNEKGLVISELKDVVRKDDKVNYGVVQPGDDVANGVPLIRVGDFNGMKISKENLKRIAPEIESQYKRSRIVGDEIFVACVGSIGKVALADESLKGFNTVRAVARIRCSEKVNRNYLAYYFSTPFIQNYFTNQTRTVSQPTLNIKQIEETKIILPPLPLQQKFASIVEQVEQLRVKQRESERELDNLFNSLMQRYFGD